MTAIRNISSYVLTLSQTWPPPRLWPQPSETQTRPCDVHLRLVARSTPQELACSLSATNSVRQLVVLAVRGELASGTVQAVEAVATVRYAAPVFFESVSSRR